MGSHFSDKVVLSTEMTVLTLIVMSVLLICVGSGSDIVLISSSYQVPRHLLWICRFSTSEILKVAKSLLGIRKAVEKYYEDIPNLEKGGVVYLKLLLDRFNNKERKLLYLDN